MKKLILFLILVASCFWEVQAQATFDRTIGVFGGDRPDYGQDVLQLDDCSYLVLSISSNHATILQKVDEFGNHLWTRSYDFAGLTDFQGNSMVQTPSGDILIAGLYDTGNFASYLLAVHKVDANGNCLWTKTYHNLGNSGGSYESKIIATSDGKYAITGTMLNSGAFITKIYDNGNWYWTNTYSSGTSATDITELSTGDLAVTGKYNGIYLLITDAFGVVSCENYFADNTSYATGNAIIETNDGHLAIAGTTGLGTSRSSFLLKTNICGSVLWAENYLPDNTDLLAEDLVQNADDTYNIVGTARFPNEIFMLKADNNGNFISSENYTETSIASKTQLIKARDGGYAIAGTRFQTSGQFVGEGLEKAIPNFDNIRLIKTDAAGGLNGCEIAHTYSQVAYSPPLTALSGTPNGLTVNPPNVNMTCNTPTLDEDLDCVGGIAMCNSPSQVGDWTKIYGNTLENKPTAVKAINDGLYVAGTVAINGDLHPTMSKFDITSGTLLWETQLDYPGEIRDFENGGSGNIIAVGRTAQPGVTGNHDNTSFILKFDNSGSIIAQKVYDLEGRETFNRILRHKAPKNTAFPYYILGAKNPLGGPLYRDLCFLINLDANLNVNWFTDYENSIEMEIMRGLVDLSSGDLLIMGNGSISAPNDGVLLEVDGQAGYIQLACIYPHGLDLHDGIEMPDGNIMLSGTQFLPNLDATLFVVDGTQYLPIGTGITFPDIKNFKNVWINQDGEFFTIGEQDNSTPNLHIIHRVALDVTGNLNVLYRGTIEDGEQEFSNPNIFASEQYNTVFYADGRRYNRNGFGDYDMLVGVFTNSENCVSQLPDSSQPYTYTAGAFNPTVNHYYEPPFTTPFSTLPPGYLCNLFCESAATDSTCLYFDGNDDRIQAPGTGLNAIGTGDFTFEAQIRGQETGQVTSPSIFSNRVSSSGGVLFFLASWTPAGPNRVLSVQLGGTNYLILNNGTYNASILDGECHHVAITRQGTLLSFYIDGALIGTKTLATTLSVAAGDLVIGGDNVSSNQFEGHISDVRIWNVAHTAVEIQNSATGLLTGTEPNLIANWQLNEGNGQTIFDNSSNVYDGVLGTNASTENTDPSWEVECCNTCDPVELVIDGDFDDPTGSSFTSLLSQNCTCAGSSWCIGTTPRDKCNNSLWGTFGAPAACSPNFLIVDGFGGTGGTVWSQTVNVTAGSNYEFSFWYYPDMSGGGTPNLDIKLGSTTLGSTTGIAGAWTKFTFYVQANIPGPATLRIVQTTAPQYSDFAIDHISFKEDCDPCCKGYEAFDTRISGFLTSSSPSPACDITVAPQTLGKCDRVTFLWGDGNVSGPFTAANGTISHSYPTQGTYTICMFAEEIDENGQVCWSKEFCSTVDITCVTWEICDPVIDLSGATLYTEKIHARDELISTGTIPPGANVTLKAGQCVRLDGGFSSDANADLEILIEDCVLTGAVLDINNNPIADVLVKKGDVVLTATNPDGTFELEPGLTDGDVLTFERDGFVTVSKVFKDDLKLSIFMKDREVPIGIDAAEPHTLTYESGLVLEIPAEAFSLNGEKYTGEAVVTATTFDATDQMDLISAPGAFIAESAEPGNLLPLTSYGIMEILVCTPENIPLQLDTEIAIVFPLTNDETPQTVNWYELNEATGYWSLSGTLVNNGNQLQGAINTVNSAWNADEPCAEELICVEVNIQYANGNFGCGIGASGITYQGFDGLHSPDQNGNVQLMVCPDSVFELQACFLLCIGCPGPVYTQLIDLQDFTPNPTGCTDIGTWIIPN